MAQRKGHITQRHTLKMAEIVMGFTTIRKCLRPTRENPRVTGVTSRTAVAELGRGGRA
jgi:hypothetical protein